MIDSNVAREIHSESADELDTVVSKQTEHIKINWFMIQILIAAILIGSAFGIKNMLPAEFEKISDIYRDYMYDSLFVDELPQGVKIIETLGR